MTGHFVNQEAKHIKCNPLGVEKVAGLMFDAIVNDGFGRKMWEEQGMYPEGLNEKEIINWVFFLDTVNFSFWPDEGEVKFGIRDKNGKLQTGYWSLCAAVNRALNDGIPIIDAEFMANATMEQAEMIFKSDTKGKIPLLDERLKALNEAGRVLLEKFSGYFSFCVTQAGKDVQKLLDIIVDNFASYRDMTEYKNKPVSFYKRAQVLISDIWTCMRGKGLGEFHDMQQITMFADYRVPQALVAFDVLQYSEELKSILRNRIPIAPGDELESEIRGMCIYGCDMVVEKIEEMALRAEKKIEVNAMLVDNFLWGWARENRPLVDKLPFHRCRTIYY